MYGTLPRENIVIGIEVHTAFIENNNNYHLVCDPLRRIAKREQKLSTSCGC
jgi:hypothetical protein